MMTLRDESSSKTAAYKHTILQYHETRVKREKHEKEEQRKSKLEVELSSSGVPLDSDPLSPLSDTLEGGLLYNPVSTHTSKLRGDILITIKKATGSIRRTVARNPMRWLRHLRGLILDNKKEIDG